MMKKILVTILILTSIKSFCQVGIGVEVLGGLTGAGGNAAVVGAIEKQSVLMTTQNKAKSVFEKLAHGENISKFVEMIQQTKSVIGTMQSVYALQEQVRRDMSDLTNYSLNLGESINDIMTQIYNSIPAGDYTNFYKEYMERTAPIRNYNGRININRLVSAAASLKVSESKEGLQITVENELFQRYYQMQYNNDLADYYDELSKNNLMLGQMLYYYANADRGIDVLKNKTANSSTSVSRKEYEERMQIVQDLMKEAKRFQVESMRLRTYKFPKSEVEMIVEQSERFYDHNRMLMKFFAKQNDRNYTFYGDESWAFVK